MLFVTLLFLKIASIEFTDFELEESTDCLFDFVDVLNGDLSEPLGSELGHFCGSSNPGIITAAGNKMLVVFYSDRLYNFRGFSATYYPDVVAGKSIALQSRPSQM